MRKVALKAHRGGDARKDSASDGGQQSRRGGDWRCTQNNLEGESLSESPRAAPIECAKQVEAIEKQHTNKNSKKKKRERG